MNVFFLLHWYSFCHPWAWTLLLYYIYVEFIYMLNLLFQCYVVFVTFFSFNKLLQFVSRCFTYHCLWLLTVEMTFINLLVVGTANSQQRWYHTFHQILILLITVDKGNEKQQIKPTLQRTVDYIIFKKNVHDFSGWIISISIEVCIEIFWKNAIICNNGLILEKDLRDYFCCK